VGHKNELQSCFVLHSRPWRETSLLLDVLSENYGKIGLCARGVRGKKSSQRSLLQPLTPLLLSWTGKGDLQTLTRTESAGAAIKLTGTALYSSFYLNELMVRLLHRHDPHPRLFHHYQQTLQKLSKSNQLEQTLREFELQLLLSLGYGINFEVDNNGEPISENISYRLAEEGMFIPLDIPSSCNNTREFSGSDLLSIADKNWQNSTVLKAAKRILRYSLNPLLGDKPLQSRKLFRRNVS